METNKRQQSVIRLLTNVTRFSDRISEFNGHLAGWMFFIIGLFVSFEVFMRHVLTMPTVWVDEVSRIFQIWATFLAIAYVLKHRQHILIDICFRNKSSIQRLWVETFSLFIIIFFSVTTSIYSFKIWLKSSLAGHTTDTYLAVPKVFIESALWIGFSLLALQALAEIIKVWTDRILIQDPSLEDS